MKQTSITKLSEIYNGLKDMDKAFHDFGIPRLLDLIKEVIRAETQVAVKGSKFNFYDYTIDEKDFRAVLSGVFHKEGWRVACDSYIMVALKEEYATELEGKIVKEDGSFVEGEYPKWRSVVPDKTKMRPFEVDAQKFYDWVSERRIEWKAETGKGKKWGDKWAVRVGDAVLKAEFFDKVLTAMKEIGTNTLYVADSRRVVLAETEKGLVILMPIIEPREGWKVLTLA